MKLNGTQQPLTYVNYVNSLTENTNTINKNTQIVLAGSTEISLEVHEKRNQEHTKKIKSPLC
jgi:uncharacterized protein YbcV (DUF1398 family)